MLSNNPVNETLTAAMNEWPKAKISCLVSIGSGKSLEQYANSERSLARLAIDSERVARLFVHQNHEMVLSNKYFRFSVPRGLEKVGFVEIEKLDVIESASALYCRDVQTSLTIQRCADRLRRSDFLSSGESMMRQRSHWIPLTVQSG